MLWLRAGACGERIDTVSEDDWSLPVRAQYGVLFDTAMWAAFVAEVARRADVTHVLIVTDSLVKYQQVVARISARVRTARPYADYLRSFEINTLT